MADPSQLEIIRLGVNAWNAWKSEHPDAMFDLSDAQLGGADLCNADLNDVELGGANLRGANLDGASFINAFLRDADLEDASLNSADLSHATLIGANLIHANLNFAVLSDATLEDANLSTAFLIETTLARSNLYGANLKDANLMHAILSDADLTEAHLEDAYMDSAILYAAQLNNSHLANAILNNADLQDAILDHTDLSGASLKNVKLRRADLTEANLSGADLEGADLTEANFKSADLSGASLNSSILVRANIDGAKISGSSVYGVSVWDIAGEFSDQKDLTITPRYAPVITVDNIKVAQFIYLILNNQEIRDVINTLTSKTVLILGRFAIPERMVILDALRNKLREYDLLPIVFDFDRPPDKDFTETIKTLAGISYFVIADVTNPKSSPLELQATVPDYQIPFAPIIQEGEKPFAMMVDLQKKYNWVLKTVSYDSGETLMKVLKPLIIDPAMKKRQELRLIKAQEPEVISGKDFLDKTKE